MSAVALAHFLHFGLLVRSISLTAVYLCFDSPVLYVGLVDMGFTGLDSLLVPNKKSTYLGTPIPPR